MKYIELGKTGLKPSVISFGGIPINHCFTMKNYMVNYGLADWAIPKYEAFAAHAGDCIECGVCETRCPYNLPIRQMLKEVKDVFGK